jgi:hypothetical protein
LAVLLLAAAPASVACGGRGISEFTRNLPSGSTAVALRNVRVIDGTGQPARDAQTVVIHNG